MEELELVDRAADRLTGGMNVAVLLVSSAWPEAAGSALSSDTVPALKARWNAVQSLGNCVGAIEGTPHSIP